MKVLQCDFALPFLTQGVPCVNRRMAYDDHAVGIECVITPPIKLGELSTETLRTS